MKRTNETPFSSLLQSLPNLISEHHSPAAKDKKIIGDLLQTIHELEGALDHALSLWVIPLSIKSRAIFSDELLSRCSLRDKARFAVQIGIIEKSTKDEINLLSDERNNLAHRRPENKRPHILFDENKQLKFKNKAKESIALIEKRIYHSWEGRVMEDFENTERLKKVFYEKKKSIPI